MVSDDERREVARRLREIGYTRTDDSMIFAYIDALDIEGYVDWVVIANRLADLIKPSCDCDALLALADELEHVALEGDNNGDELVLSRGAAFHYSRRIREALGVSE